ncbi:Ubiquitinyl hydrolase [Parasponia andersonii]|uniref:Ubiquitin carboxyl-terminal hydrolase n=1 Tax=Parasponia andersonii TaxID=3476 RepID=A0A2P5BGZ1_PARAD|nr:Ubiquitinyl hydrolase [Parasponia andersonii]
METHLKDLQDSYPAQSLDRSLPFDQSDVMVDLASAASPDPFEAEIIDDLSLALSESLLETLADDLESSAPELSNPTVESPVVVPCSDGAENGESSDLVPPPQGVHGNNLSSARNDGDGEEEAPKGRQLPSSPYYRVRNGLSGFDSSRVWLSENISWPSTGSSFSIREAKPSTVGAGLMNLGNTCFINSVLQCFTHTVLLVQGLLSCNHAMGCGSFEDFCVLCELYHHIQLSMKSSGGIISPVKFVNNLTYFSSSFLRYQQEDAHEFLQCFLDKLERCFLDSKTKKNSLTSPGENLVHKVYGGRLISKLQCCNCGHSSDTFEPLIDLSLEIENVDSLPSALESFTNEEKIEDSETKFTCENCKEEVAVVKQLMVDQAPSVAIFHLKRFKNDGSFVQKIDKHVKFPLELDLKSYTSGDNVELMYDLYAIVVHVGLSPMAGHYFSFVRSSPDTWHRLDDSKVTRVPEEFVLSQDAYILFYVRRGTPWFSSLMGAEKQSFDPDISSTSPLSVLDTVENACPLPSLADINDTLIAPDADDCVEKISCVDVNMCTTTSLGENNCQQEVELDEEKFSGDDVFHPLTPPRSKSPDMFSFEIPVQSYQIPRNHLKSEGWDFSRKRSLNKAPDDSEAKEAIRYLTKSMPSSRGRKLLDAMCRPQSEPASRKKKRLDSPCKRAGPANAHHKSDHGSVVHPVAAVLR